MKTVEIFHYESIHKFYLSSEVLEDQRPSIGLPANSTDLSPTFEKVPIGFIPVFDGEEWNIMPDTFWRPKYIEINYDAGRNAETYVPLHLSLYSQFSICYPTMGMLCNIEKIIIGDGVDYQKDSAKFLKIFNDLFHSFKHSLIHDESYQLMCPDTPAITSYQAKNNNHNNEIIYHNHNHNHNLYHIMMGFQDNVLRIPKIKKFTIQKTINSNDGAGTEKCRQFQN